MTSTKEQPGANALPAAPVSSQPPRLVWLSRLAWLPIPIFALAMVVLKAAGLQGAYDSPDLLMALNFVFSTMASLFIAYLVARSFLIQGTPGLLMLGCGVVIWGLAAVVAVAAGKRDEHDVNIIVTIHNVCVSLSALCYLAGVTLSLLPNRPIRQAGLLLAAGYAGALAAVGLVTISTLAHWMPIFFVQGQGGTMVRWFTLSSAAAMFALTAVLLVATAPGTASAFRRWYAMALALIAVGLLGVMMEPTHGDALSWTGRASQFLSGVYMVIAAIASVRESRAWGIPLESALAQERTNLQSIFDVVNIGMLLIDQDGAVKRVNNAVARWIGKDPSAMHSAQPGDLVGCIHALANPAGCGRTPYCASCPIRSTFETALRTGEPVHDVEAQAKLFIDGKEVRLWLDVSADPLVLNERRHVILALNNITARKQAEEELRLTAEDLARSNRDLEQFAYVASHDLKEPLRMVTGFLDLLKQSSGDALDAKCREYVDFAVDGGTRMQTLIDDLLTYARAGTSKAADPADLGAVLDGVCRALRFDIEGSGAIITHDPLPTVRANAIEMSQVLQNLIGNAIKFRGDRKPEIHVGAQPRDGNWLFWIEDNGIGIDPQFADRIFNIFQRLHTRDQYPGTGIGLAICKKIVERHGGRIWVESQPGRGATFYFTIPGVGKEMGL
jgi:signal transduction histidine kinase